MAISTHVYDTAQGCAAAGLEVALAYLQEDGKWLDLGSGPTDAAGRIDNLLPRSWAARAGMYRISYATSHYFALSGQNGLFPVIPVVVELATSDAELNIALLLSRYGYTVSQS